MNKLFVLLFFICTIKAAYAQQTNITGQVISKETHQPAANIIVDVYDTGKKIHVTITDSTGIFKIPERWYKQAIYIRLHSLNFADLQVSQLPAIDLLSQKKYFLGQYEIAAKSIMLKEVEVQKKRYSDTTNIDLSKKNFERSVMITDIFSSEMGFSKDEKGQLLYKGKPVGDVQVNGGSFFGKSNMAIYNLLPALVLNNIEITETDIDSTTNTTSLRPTVKVNLKLKDKFKKGKFGNANLGGGTSNRYIINSNLYTYSGTEQISLSTNLNNINIEGDLIGEPVVKFSVNGNNTSSNNLKLFYRNVFFRKVETDLSIKGNVDNRYSKTEIERQDQNVNQFSNITNQSKARTLGISEANFNIHYPINSLNTIYYTQKYEYNKLHEQDSLKYHISNNTTDNLSDQFKNRTVLTNLLLSKLHYDKRFSSKKGRLLDIDVTLDDRNNNISDLNNVSNLSNKIPDTYFIDGKRKAGETTISFNTDFTEPLGDEAYINFFSGYKTDKINYNANINTDTVVNENNNQFRLSYQYYESGFKLQKKFDKFSLYGELTGILNSRNGINNPKSLFFINSGLKLDYKINKKNNLLVDYKSDTHYPDITQLTSINNTFDLVSQMGGNPNLRPEQKNSIRLDYSIKKSDSERFSFNGGYDYFSSKFGFNIVTESNTGIQHTFLDNVGNASSGQLGFSFFKNITNTFYLDYGAIASMQQMPVINDGKISINNSLNINQSLSTSKEIIKSVLSFSPVLSLAYNKSNYNSTSSKTINIIYTDNISIDLFGYQLNMFPRLNYNHSITDYTSFSMNAGIKKNLFKRYGTLWIQGYDLLNSFKYNNNYIGATYTQSVSYSNTSRYIIIGFSLQFNNMK